MVQQAGVVDGGGGGETDGSGRLIGGGDLAGVGGRAVQGVEEAVAVGVLAVGGGQGHALFGEEPVNKGLGPGGVDRHAGYRTAVGVSKGGVGVHRQQGVGVKHLVIILLEDHRIHWERGGIRVGDGGLALSLRELLSGRGSAVVFAAAGQQAQEHGEGEKAGNKLFHMFIPPGEKIQ